MARKLKMSAVILNIRLHPHSEEIYANFIEAIYNLKKPVQVHGDRYGIISSIDKTESKSGIISGAITTFTRIETDTRWFDTSGLREATDRQVSQINIPANLAPNSASFYWAFDVKKHKLFVQSYSGGKSLSAKQAQMMFSALSRDMEITTLFNEAKISIVQSPDALEAMFRIPRIKQIKITILRPNPDVFSDDFEANIEQHLADNHSRQLTLTYDAEKGSSIQPGNQIRAVSHAALTNGEVEVKGRDETGAITRSTKEHPKVLQDKYDPEQTSERNAFRQLISQ